MTVYKFDDAKLSWECIHTFGCKHSIFVGLNYPFHMESEWVETNSVCVADLDDTYYILHGAWKGAKHVVDRSPH
jgi:hypothetical protein